MIGGLEGVPSRIIPLNSLCKLKKNHQKLLFSCNSRNNLVSLHSESQTKVLSTTELGAGDGGSDGYIKALGSLARGVVVGNEQFVGDELANGRRDAVALVAHNDDALVGELLFIDVLTVE